MSDDPSRPAPTDPSRASSPGAPIALRAADVPARATPSNYPEPFASRMAGRTKRALGDAFGLASFGANPTTLAPGDCAGFPANGVAHHLVNRSDAPLTYLEIGDRAPGDAGSYPDDDLVAVRADGRWTFTRKDGSPYA